MRSRSRSQLIAFISILFLFNACHEERCEVIEHYPDGKTKTVACPFKGLYFYSQFGKNQDLEMTYFLDDSSRYQGEITYYSDGRISETGFFKDDKRQDWFTVYDDLGKVHSRTFFMNDTIVFRVQYGEDDPYRVFQPRMQVKSVDTLGGKINLQVEFNFPLKDTSINLEHVVYATGLKRFDEKPDTISNGLKDIFISVERENYPKEVDLSFIWKDPPILYYYMIDTTAFEIIEPPLIDLSGYIAKL